MGLPFRPPYENVLHIPIAPIANNDDDSDEDRKRDVDHPFRTDPITTSITTNYCICKY